MTYPKIFEQPRGILHPRITIEQAQSIFESWLKENSKVVYGWDHSSYWRPVKTECDKPTHTALIVNIQEVEKKECEHDSRGHTVIDGGFLGTCVHCGTKLKASWSVVE